MNTLIKRAMIAAGIATATVLPLAGEASDGTITFTGAVTASTCTVNVNGSGSNNATVALPVVDTSALTGTATAQSTAAGTFFNVAMSNCTAAADIGDPAAAPTTVAIYFEAGGTVDEATGGLINTATGGSNVEVKLFNASGSTVVGTQIMPGTATNQPTAVTISTITAASETQWFYAGYATLGTTAATAGAVNTYVTYSMVYN
jgi:major type 1 subunit fimbrin (pilin)